MSRQRKRAVRELARALDQGGRADELNTDGMPDEQAELVATARAVATHSRVPRPDPAFRVRQRSELLAQIGQDSELDHELAAVRDTDGSASSGGSTETGTGAPRGRRMSRMILAAALATVMLGGTAVANTATQAEPGDALYQVKRLTESARMALASGNAETGQLHLRFAKERVAELTGQIEELPQTSVVDILSSMDQATEAAVDQLVAADQQTEGDALVQQLREFLDHQHEQLSALPDDLPGGIAPSVEDSLALVERLRERVPSADAPCTDCGGAESVPGAVEEHGNEPGDDEASTDPQPTQAGSGDGSSTDSGSSDPQDQRPASGTQDDGGQDQEPGDTVRETTEQLNETVERTTETVGKLLEDTNRTLNELLGGDRTTDGAGGAGGGDGNGGGAGPGGLRDLLDGND